MTAPYGLLLRSQFLSLVIVSTAALALAGEGRDTYVPEEAHTELEKINALFDSGEAWDGLDRLRAARVAFDADRIDALPMAKTALKNSLTAAAARGFHDIAAKSMEVGADPNQKHNGYTPIFWAAYRGDNRLTQELLQSGADPNSTNNYGMTALVEPVWQGKEELVLLLLKGGADPNTPGKFGSPLIFDAVDKGLPEVVKALAKAGADLKLRRHWSDGEPILLSPVLAGDEDTVRALIEGKADLNAKWQGKRISWYARKNGKKEIHRILRSAGAKR